MSAEAWHNEEDARNLLQLLPGDFSRRKLRWFVIEHTRPRLSQPFGPKVNTILALAERVADGTANVENDECVRTADELNSNCEDGNLAPEGHAGHLIFMFHDDVFDAAQWILDDKSESENTRAVGLLREVFGNPFRPLDFAPWRTDTAVALARAMYESREFGAMPILADALQDAGCDSDEVLAHCRDAAQVHVRGCWVVDGVLGLS